MLFIESEIILYSSFYNVEEMYEQIDYYEAITKLLKRKLLQEGKPCCQKQYLGLFLRNAILRDKANKDRLLTRDLYATSESLEFLSDENFHIMKVLPLFKELYGINVSLKIHSFAKATNKLIYSIKIHNYSPFIGRRLMILDESFRFMYGLSISLLYKLNPCDIKEIVKATLLFGSNLYIKNNGLYGHNLRIYSPNTNFALSISRIFRKLNIRSIFSKNKNSLTLVDEKSIKNLLVLIECEEFIEQFKLSNIALATLNNDNANIIRSNKASKNAIKHIEKALILQKKYNYPISDKLLDAINLRLKYKSATLSQLGTRATPPLSKDAIASRIRRFIQIMNGVEKQKLLEQKDEKQLLAHDNID